VKHNANLWLLEDCALSCLMDRSVVVLGAVKAEAWAKSWVKLNSCAHPQKQRNWRGYYEFFISIFFFLLLLVLFHV